MSSTNKTQIYALNQWVASDPVLREDFNADNAILDTILSGKSEFVLGSYTGTGTSTVRLVDLGFKPKAVLLFPSNNSINNNYLCFGLAFNGYPLASSSTAYCALKIASSGFEVLYDTNYYVGTNKSGAVYYYLAFK